MGAGGADREHLVAAAREQHRLLADVPGEHAAVRQVTGRNALRQVGTGRLRWRCAHGDFPRRSAVRRLPASSEDRCGTWQNVPPDGPSFALRRSRIRVSAVLSTGKPGFPRDHVRDRPFPGNVPTGTFSRLGHPMVEFNRAVTEKSAWTGLQRSMVTLPAPRRLPNRPGRPNRPKPPSRANGSSARPGPRSRMAVTHPHPVDRRRPGARGSDRYAGPRGPRL